MSSRSDEDAPEMETLPPEAEAFERPTAVGRGVLDVTQVAHLEPPSSGRRAVGLTWADVLSTGPSLGVKLRALVETLETLAAIHTNLVRPPRERCHGALNPHLLLLAADGRVSVFWQSLDGIDPVRLLPYVAPEIQAGAEPDQQADLYSVGVMLFEALTDRFPDAGEALPLAQRGAHHLETETSADALLKVALRALPSNPRRRWPSALSFAEALSKSAGPLLASRDELGQLVARAASQKERLLREAVRKQHALLPPPGSADASAFSDPLSSSLAAIAISQNPGPHSYEPSNALVLASRHSLGRRRYPLYAVAVVLTLALGLWLISRSTRETARGPSERADENLRAPAPATREAKDSQLSPSSAQVAEGDEVSESPPAKGHDEPSAPEQAEAETKARAKPGAGRPAATEEEGPAKAGTDSKQRLLPKRAPKHRTYEPEGI